MALFASVARVIFGPVGDPFGLHAVTLTVPEVAQAAINAVFTVSGYVAAALTLSTLAAHRDDARRWQTAAARDALTGVSNRRSLDAFLEDVWGQPGAVVAVDADHFKRINDEHGHAAVDAVLVELAARLQRVVRNGDLVARSGGEEFVLVLVGATLHVAARVARHGGESVREAPVQFAGGHSNVTVSVGAAAGVLGRDLLEAADRALYAAKAAGRDCLRSGRSPRGHAARVEPAAAVRLIEPC